MKKDYFEHKAEGYDLNEKRVDNVDNIANGVMRSAHLNQSMHLMDFGSGTGLLLERIAPFVKKITAVDISSSMNDVLRNKKAELGCEIEILEIDLLSQTLDVKFDGIISSMTMHHIEDTDAMFDKFYSLLVDGGFIALADLDSEDGSFHGEDTGVHHFGFDREEIVAKARLAGFRNVTIIDVSTVQNPRGNYPVFLLKAEK